MSNLIDQEQLQPHQEFDVLDFEEDGDLQHYLEQHLEQEEYQQEETQVQALSRNDQEEAAHTTLSLMPQFQDFYSPSATTKSHHRTRPRNPMKRPLPFSILDQQMAKKPQLLESQENNHSLNGFTKLALPVPQSQTPVTHLLRAASAPASFLFDSNNFSATVSGSNGNANANINANCPISPEQVGVGVNPTTPSPVKSSPSSVSRRGVDSGSVKPPLPPTIRRTVSDPSPVSGGGTSVNESPLSKKLRMMKHDLKLMSHWCDQVIRGEEEEKKAASQEKDNATGGHETENGTQEAVSVEIIGDCLFLHFNCPCGRGYQILLTGKNCYYKLV